MVLLRWPRRWPCSLPCLASDPDYGIVHLNSIERQAQFWESTTLVGFDLGESSYSLVAVGDGAFEIFASVADYCNSGPVVWKVGEFSLSIGLPLGGPSELSVFVQTAEFGGLHFEDGMARAVAGGHAIFGAGLEAYITGIVVVSEDIELASGYVIAGDTVFVPIRLHLLSSSAELDAFATSMAATGASVPPPNRDLSAEELAVLEEEYLEQSGCPWTWCHRPNQFCQDMAECRTNRDTELANVRAARSACLVAAEVAYEVCMQTAGCWENGQLTDGWFCAAADIACSAARGTAEAACRAAYLGLTTAAELNFQACGASAKEE